MGGILQQSEIHVSIESIENTCAVQLSTHLMKPHSHNKLNNGIYHVKPYDVDYICWQIAFRRYHDNLN